MRPLLTIAIPTWNRVDYLQGAINRLIPQINQFREKIELVISNNGSTDNTREYLNEIVNLYPQIQINVHNYQTNTGYFGNFLKCRELAIGKFIWLLSDDDYVSMGVVKQVITILENEGDIGLIFLEGWYGEPTENLWYSKVLCFDEIWMEHKHRLTLISAVIFKNDKQFDDLINMAFSQNVFLGFVYLMQACTSHPTGVVVYGKSLSVSIAKRTYNFFEAWLVDMYSVLQYFLNKQTITLEMYDVFVNSFLCQVLHSVYLEFRYKDKINENNSYATFHELDNKLRSVYGEVSSYKHLFIPFKFLPRQFVPVYQFISKIPRRLSKVIKMLRNFSIIILVKECGVLVGKNI